MIHGKSLTGSQFFPIKINAADACLKADYNGILKQNCYSFLKLKICFILLQHFFFFLYFRM